MMLQTEVPSKFTNIQNTTKYIQRHIQRKKNLTDCWIAIDFSKKIYIIQKLNTGKTSTTKKTNASLKKTTIATQVDNFTQLL